MKKVSIGGKPTASKTSAVMDEWVNRRKLPTPEHGKRLTIDITETLHRRIKTQCVAEGLVMAEVIRDLLEKRFPAP